MRRGLLLWDIDGTLVQRSSSQITSIHLRALGKEAFVKTSSELTGFTDWEVLKHYESEDRRAKEAFGELDRLQEKEKPTEFARIRGIDERIFDDLAPMWDHGILSGNSLRRALFKLRSINLNQYFQNETIFACSPYDTREKIALRMLKEIGKKYDAIVLIGDTLNDIKTAKKANLPIVAVATGNHTILQLNSMEPSLAIENLADQKELFYNFLNSLAM